MNATDDHGMTGFAFACGNGHDLAVSMLLNHIEDLGIDPNITDQARRNAFIWACIKGRPKVVEMLIKNSEKLGIDLNHKDKDGMTGLMHACKEKKYFVVAVFFRLAKIYSIEFNCKDTKYGRTAYIWSAYKCKKDNEVFEAFHEHAKKYKIDLKIKDKKGQSGVDYIKKNVLSGEFGRTQDLGRDDLPEFLRVQINQRYRKQTLRWDSEHGQFAERNDSEKNSESEEESEDDSESESEEESEEESEDECSYDEDDCATM